MDYKDQDSHGAKKKDAPIFICVPQIFQSDLQRHGILSCEGPSSHIEAAWHCGKEKILKSGSESQHCLLVDMYERMWTSHLTCLSSILSEKKEVILNCATNSQSYFRG